MSKFIRLIIITGILALYSSNSSAQSILDSLFTKIPHDQPILTLLDSIERTGNIRMFYISKWLTPYQVSKDWNGQTLANVLKLTLSGTPITFVVINGRQLIFVKDESFEKARQLTFEQARQKQNPIRKITIGDPEKPSQGKIQQLAATLVNQNKIPITNATIRVDQLKDAVITNQTGRFTLNLSPGEHYIVINHLNYQQLVVDLDLFSGGSLELVLEDNPVYLDDIFITGQSITERNVGQTMLKVSELKRAPAFLGEIDLIKQIQQEAGVTSVGEIANGFNVRGGSIDQNLILFDGVPIYNTAHALGFFNGFQANAISNISFYKGGIPASFGGRTSSIINAVGKYGDNQRWRFHAGIGFISNHVTAEGPIKKDTSSLLLSFRSTYSNWLLRAIQSNYLDLSRASLNFFDGNIKYHHRLSPSSQLSISGYVSQDGFRLVNDTTFQWQNIAIAGNYSKDLKNNWFTNFIVGYSQYSFTLNDTEPSEAFSLRYRLINPTIKADFAHEGSFKINTGIHLNYFQFQPGSLLPGSKSDLQKTSMQHENAQELSIYVSGEYPLQEKLVAEAGLRYAFYLRFGAGTEYQYKSGQPLDPENTTGIETFRRGQWMKIYHGPEPRLSIRYKINDGNALKLGYNRLYQFMHLVTNTAVPTPVDIWQLSNSYFKPQIANQLSAGYFKGNTSSIFDISIEAFGKRIINTLDFKDGATLILNKQLETALLAGITTAYGIELSAIKKMGRLVGTANYTYSRSFRNTTSSFLKDQINENKRYPSNFDQPHVININWRFNITKRYFLSGNFNYHSGRPITMPSSFYIIDGIPISDFRERNNFRLADYHRLDLAFIAEGNHKIKKLWSGTWTLSFYNVYARRNPYSIFFKPDNFGQLKPYQLTLIGAMIPSLSYTIKI